MSSNGPSRRSTAASLPFLLIACLMLAAVPGRADQRKDAERELRKQLEGNVLTLQKFYKGDWLRFDAHGSPRDPADIGAWTLYAKLQVDKVKLGRDELEIRGHRLFLAYDDEKKDFRHIRSDQKVRVELQLERGEPALERAQAALVRVFLTGSQQLADVVPAHWKTFFASGEQRDPDFPGTRVVDGEEVHRIKEGEVEPPKCISCPDPTYPWAARQARLEGLVVLWAIVGKEGRVKRAQVAKPLGFGLDESAIEALGKWKLTPARCQGEPVPVFMVVEVNFHLY